MKTEYSYKINDENKTVAVTVVGELDYNDFAKLDAEVYSIALELNYKLVFDFTNARVRISFGEIYFWFSNYMDKINRLYRRIPIAHIANDTNANFFNFVETTWSNGGIKIKMFKEESAALKWLEQFG